MYYYRSVGSALFFQRQSYLLMELRSLACNFKTLDMAADQSLATHLKMNYLHIKINKWLTFLARRQKKHT